MLGRSHSMSGAATWLAVAPFLGVTTPQLLVGTALAAGAATLPDLDEDGSTVSRCLGPVSQAFANVLGTVAGGHRALTHSLPGAVAFGAASALLSAAHPALGAFLLGLAIAVGLEALGVNLPGAYFTECLVRAVIALPLGYLAADHLGAYTGLIVGAGCVIHDAGDALTKSGVPFLSPLSKGRWALGLFRTGGGVERGLVFPALTVTVLLLGAHSLAGASFDLPGPSGPGVTLPSLPELPQPSVDALFDDLAGLFTTPPPPG